MEKHNKNILDRRRKNICENYLLDTIVFLAVDGWLQVQGRKWRENDGSIIQHVPQSRNCPNNLTSDNFSFEWDSFSNTPEDNLIDHPLSAALKHLIEDQMKSISSRRTRIYIARTCSVVPSTQDILGVGDPCPEHESDPPVLLENPWKEGGS